MEALYKGYEYEIEVPSYETKFEEMLEIEEEVKGNELSCDFIKLFSEFESGEYVKGDPIKSGDITLMPGRTLMPMTGVEFGISLADAIFGSMKNTYINFVFKKAASPESKSRKVLILIGSSEQMNLINKYADNIERSAYWAQKEPLSKEAISASAAKYYSDLTGFPKENKTYDVRVSSDSRHKDNAYFSQLSIDENGDLIEWSIILPNDSARIVVHEGLGYKSLFNIDLKAPRKARIEVVKLFKREIDSKIV